MLQKGFFLTESHNPNLPEEEWTLVYEKDTTGSYSESCSWGKYKIVISGGGGSGAIFARYSTAQNMEWGWIQNGFAAEEKTVYIDVPYASTKTISGIIGGGASGSHAETNGYQSHANYGAIGTGYANGAQANTKYEYTDVVPGTGTRNFGAWVGGSGGGSSSLEVDGILNTISAGGNGGEVTINYNGNKTSTGGIGGSGGTKTGNGAAGGNCVNETGYGVNITSGAGANGYVRVYKSNLKPEPI